MKPAVILISGAGQLGSRYLQGLATYASPLQIHLHDVSATSLETAMGRWMEVAAADAVHQVRLHTDFATLPKSIDIVIVATTAGVRPAVVRAIRQQAKVGGWVLEKVLAQSEADLEDLLALIGQGVRAWVNTPRRILPWHKQIKENLSTNSSLHLTVSGCEWGLACNSVHFLDMLGWWAGETLVEVQTDHLHSSWIHAKRPGHYEIMGTLRARFSGGSTAVLQANEGELQYTFELTDGELIWHMDETAGTATRSDGLSVPGRLPFQSEVTAGLVETILATGNCELPTLKESVDLHRVFVAGLLAHWRKSVDTHANSLPIT
jgi:predicted dehydrogenase